MRKVIGFMIGLAVGILVGYMIGFWHMTSICVDVAVRMIDYQIDPEILRHLLVKYGGNF